MKTSPLFRSKSMETTSIRRLFPGKTPSEIASILDPAMHAFNSVRKHRLKLYPTVRSTLEKLNQHNILLVAHTESKFYAVVDRLSRLKLTPFFSHIYCRERSSSTHPHGAPSGNYLSQFPMNKVSELTHHQRKPNEDVLLEICAREGVLPVDAAYVGDSMARDVMMAKRANVTAIWAKYGTVHDRDTYDRLVRVSHWTSEDVARERLLSQAAAEIEPDFTLEHNFGEVLKVVGAGHAS